jgi:NADH-quinone oxidoreductase subunit E
MAVRRLAEEQPPSFAFTPENLSWCQGQIAKYPKGRQASAVIPLLWKAQEQHDNWLPRKALEEVARMLGMTDIRVLEIATFYSMFNLAPVGRHFIQMCGTTPCQLRGAQAIRDLLQQRIGDQGTISPEGFSWLEVECLGACCNAPMAQINQTYYEDLTAENLSRLLDDLTAGRPVRPGSQTGRTSSEFSAGKATTLSDASLYDGSRVGAWRARFADESGAPAGELQPQTQPAVTASAPLAASAAAAPTKPALGGPETAIAVPTPVVSGKVAASETATTAPHASVVASATVLGVSIEPVEAGENAPRASIEISVLAPASDVAGATPTSVLSRVSVVTDLSINAAEDHAGEAAEMAARLAGMPAGASAEDKAHAVGTKPQALEAPKGGEPDDLKRIRGIGRVNEGRLNALGIYHFDQIAAWTRPEIRWVATYLSFPGRIDREDWVGQARILATGAETEFSLRVEKGEVPSSAGGAPHRDEKEG